MRKALIFIVVLTLLTFGCSQRAPWSMTVSRTVLGNGLTVLVHENHDRPIVVLKVYIKGGALCEPEEKAGLAGLAGSLLTKGTKTRSAGKIASAIEFVGGGIGAGGGETANYVSCQVLKKDLDLALDLLSDVLLNPAFDPAEIEKERASVLSGIRAGKDDPAVTARLAFDELVYGRHPFHRPLSGYEQTVRSISRQDLVEFYQKYYTPNNTVLAVAGDVDPQGLLPKIREKFSPWPKRAVEFPKVPAVARQTTIKKKDISMNKEQVQILLGHLGIRRSDTYYYTLVVMDNILGAGGMSSRIPYDLRDIKGLAYSAYSDMTGSAGLEPGVFLAYMAVAPANKDKAVAGLLTEMKRIQAERISARELADAKAFLTGSYYFGLQGNNALADYLLFCEVYRLGFDYLAKYPGYINRVTSRDIQQVARKYLHPEAYTLVTAGPENN